MFCIQLEYVDIDPGMDDVSSIFVGYDALKCFVMLVISLLSLSLSST